MPYVIRTCNADMTSYKGFKWPKKGFIEAPDWRDDNECGGGLHGFLNGQGDGALADWSNDAVWMLVEIPDYFVNLNGKVKFQSGNVIKTGSKESVIAELKKKVKGLTAVIGDTLTGGDDSTLTGGDDSTLTGGDRSTLTGGDRSTLTGGDRSTLTGGYGSTLTGGDDSTLIFKYWNGSMYKISCFYTGEEGTESNKAYTVDDKGCLVPKD